MCNLLESQFKPTSSRLSLSLSLSLYFVASGVYVCSCRFFFFFLISTSSSSSFFYTNSRYWFLCFSSFSFFSFVRTRDMDTQWKGKKRLFFVLILYKISKKHGAIVWNVRLLIPFSRRFPPSIGRAREEMIDWFDPVTHTFVSLVILCTILRLFELL